MTAPELPPLTHEVYPETWIAARPDHQIFTAEHMRAYGRQCFAAGMEATGRVLDATDPFCPKCGHNRDKSSVSSIDHGAGRRSCQMCGAEWTERAACAPK
jgi:formate dehydrogenase maturation protein FdhE